MSRKFKTILTALALCAVSAFAVAASGCNDLKETINQLKCDHVLIDGEVTKEATCTEVGEKTKKCTLCTYTETEELPMLGHSVVKLKAVSPTCTKSGLTKGEQCGVCGEILEAQEIVPATGHTAVADEAVSPTCTSTGKTAGSHCKDCHIVLIKQESIPMLDHSLKEMEAYSATCEENGFTGGIKCENCDYTESGEIIPALGHSYDDGAITIEVTCETDGEKTYTCATCEGTKTEAIPALGHDYDDGVITKEPTCNTRGEKLHTCANCGDTFTNVVYELGHTYEDGTCTVCGAGLITFTIDGVSYSAESDMHWNVWCQSDYNTAGYYSTGAIRNADGKFVVDTDGICIAGQDVIVANYTYAVFDDTSAEKVKISGVWYAKEDMGSLKETSINGKSEPEALNFKSGGYSFTEMKSEVKELLYSNGVSSITVYSICSDVVNQGWQNEVYRYVFIEGEQEVSKVFYQWFTTYFEESEEHISFAIEGTTYYAEAGMTWGEWLGSEYAGGDYFSDGIEIIKQDTSYRVVGTTTEDVITVGGVYALEIASGSSPT